jgi:hypothetical protein
MSPAVAPSFYARALAAADRADLVDARDVEGLAEEAALLRVHIRRTLEERPDDAKVLHAGIRLLVQTLLAQQRLSPRQAEDLGDAASHLVEEIATAVFGAHDADHGEETR